MANSETYANSSASHMKSPSRMDTLSVFETSPMLKRVKISEEEEKQASGGVNFQLGESEMTAQSTESLLRKSKRKKKKSKILREAMGECDEEAIAAPVQSQKKCKETKEITKILELEDKVLKREEHIPVHKNQSYLVEYEYDFGSKDIELVCFCQTISYGDMVA
jgi:hypothetical protein